MKRKRLFEMGGEEVAAAGGEEGWDDAGGAEPVGIGLDDRGDRAGGMARAE